VKQTMTRVLIYLTVVGFVGGCDRLLPLPRGSRLFTHLGYHGTVREGFPAAGSSEVFESFFVNALRKACPRLARYSDRELAPWIVARQNYLTSGALNVLGTNSKQDTNEFGYGRISHPQTLQSMTFDGCLLRKARPETSPSDPLRAYPKTISASK
jgi:hypothetical protein